MSKWQSRGQRDRRVTVKLGAHRIRPLATEFCGQDSRRWGWSHIGQDIYPRGPQPPGRSVVRERSIWLTFWEAHSGYWVKNGQQGAWVGAGRQWEAAADIQKRDGGGLAWVVPVEVEGYGQILDRVRKKSCQDLQLDWPWGSGACCPWDLGG